MTHLRTATEAPSAAAPSPSSAAPDGVRPPLGPEELARRVRELDVAAKVRLLTGATVWSLPAEPRLGLHPVVMSDGPQGVRGTGEDPAATGLLAPAPSALGATWDAGLAARLGALFAMEARRKGVQVVLAPAINLQRTPVAGRHFEYLAEDPLLTGVLAAGLVAGLQGGGVAACLKHFVANDSETDRTSYRTRLDERTLREVYLAPFAHALGEPGEPGEPGDPAGSGAWSVMAAYSGVEGDGTAGEHIETGSMTEHRQLLREVLKDEWGFAGPVVSDWEATRSTAAAANGGLDLVMPGPGGPWGEALVAAVRDGEVPESLIDDKVLRLLWLARRVGRLTGPWSAGSESAPVPPGDAAPAVPDTPEPSELALLRETSARSAVVLRNSPPGAGDGGRAMLPLDREEVRSIALIGPNAVSPYLQGGGSAYVPASRTVGFEEGLRAALPATTELTVHRGGNARMLPPFIDAGQLTADPESGRAGVRADYFAADGTRLGGALRTSGDWSHHHDFPTGTHRVVLRTRITLSEPGTHRLETGAVGRYRVLLDGELTDQGDDDRGVELILDSSHNHPRVCANEITVDGSAPRAVELEMDLAVIDAGGYGHFVTGHIRHRTPGPTTAEEIAEAVSAARRAEVAVVVVGTNEEVESEGWDRTGLELPGAQNDLVRAVAAANPRTVVVVNAGAPVLLPWASQVPALLWFWLPGQEAGHALADVLLGDSEPAGRLPWTLPARAEDVPVPHAVPEGGVVAYTEGLDIGHRAWDRERLAPAYPFGHGLGWTSWHYGALALDRATVLEQPAEPSAPPRPAPLQLRVQLTNTGERTGREVVQVYLEAPQDGPRRPPRTLAGFTTIEVEPGATATASITVPARAFQTWDPETADWRTPPGRYRLHVGRSSRDPRLTADLH